MMFHHIRRIAIGCFFCVLIFNINSEFRAEANSQLGEAVANRPVSPNTDLLPLTNIAKISVGYEHACAITNNGGIKCWGNNAYGMLGDGGTFFQSSPVNVVGLSTGVAEVATSTLHTCALTDAGGVKCWGYNTDGRLGDGTTTEQRTPVAVLGLADGVVSIAVGYNHTCVIMTSGGELRCWGNNTYGQLGNGNTNAQQTPEVVTGVTNVKAIGAGANHTCALLQNDQVHCWGNNDLGQLGNGSTASSMSPVIVTGLPGKPVALAVGANFSCVLIAETQGVQCWGYNNRRQLGNGSQVDSSTPVAVQSLNAAVTAITAGIEHACALTEQGSVKCWGNNRFGALGNNTFSEATTPVAVTGVPTGVAAVSAGGNTTCALRENSSIKCWGSNESSQLGDGVPTFFPLPQTVTGLSGAITDISTGFFHTCALTAGSNLRCWGRNHFGQLGNGSVTSSSLPVSVINLPSSIGTFAVGHNHACMLNELQTNLRCWGHNGFGQVGDGTILNRTSPVDVTNLTGTIYGIGLGTYHTCAILQDAGGVNTDIKCWGKNTAGELGDGTTVNHYIPTNVIGLSPSVAAIVGGYSHTCALMFDGKVNCWGDNIFGQLGDNSRASKTTPVPVQGIISPAKAITAGYDHTCVLTELGSVKCWGRNLSGQLGNGTVDDSGIPRDVSGLSTNISAIQAGANHTCALITNGTMKCWGYNGRGQLGNGTTVYRTTPVDVIGLDGAVAELTLGGNNTCVILRDNRAQCWGDDSYGRLGTGRLMMSPVPVDVVVGDACSTITEIPNTECHALVALYESTNGPNWANNTGWPQTTTATITPCSWFGISCRDGHVTRIVLPGNKLAGQLRPELSLLTALEMLQLNHNDLHGELPTELGDFSALKDLRLQNNQFHGPLPATLGKLKNLEHLILHQNNTLSGLLPPELGDMTNLISLHLSNNQFTGTVPSTLGNLSQLNTLGLAGTQLHGCLPISLINLTMMKDFQFHATNLAEPDTENFQTWLTGIETLVRSGLKCPPSPEGDTMDDSCLQAHTIPTTGLFQERSFETASDIDWIKFDVTANTKYRIEVQVPDSSPVNAVLELYNRCNDPDPTRENPALNPNIQVEFETTTADPIYLKLANHDPNMGGETYTYQVSVRQLDDSTAISNGAVIIVAGRIKTNDGLQRNIHNITNEVYKIFQHNGYNNDHILYLAHDATLQGRDQDATLANLKNAITTWAPTVLDANAPLTLYMVDHGDKDKFYLNPTEIITPTELHAWLSDLERIQQEKGVTINVIIEACHAGSFIEGEASISKPGRVIVTSSDAETLAYASQDGAYFSDHFLNALAQGFNLYSGFWESKISVQQSIVLQTPWLDANGNGIHNELDDASIAAQRGFHFPGTLDPQLTINYPPFIEEVSIAAATGGDATQITAKVQDDEEVQRVWAVVYPPSYVPPIASSEIVPEAPPIDITTSGKGGIYLFDTSTLTESGIYRIVIHAQDENGLLARPKSFTFANGSQLFLPIILR